MGYVVRERDQWGEVRYRVEGDRIWERREARGICDFLIEAAPHDSTCRCVKRETTYGEKLLYLQPDPHGDGLLVRERDMWGAVAYFVEQSRYDEHSYLVREGGPQGSVIYYVQPIDAAGAAEGAYRREPTALDRAFSALLAMLMDAFMAPKQRFGRSGAVVALLGWFVFLNLVGLIAHALGLLGWYAIPFGLLVVWGMFQIIGLYQ